MTFSEAAGVISILYQNFPDERYSQLLESFLRQCARDKASAAPAQPSSTRDAAARPAALTQATPVINGGQP